MAPRLSYDVGMDPARATAEERLTIVPDELQAEMVRSVLAAHDIHSVIRRPALGEIQWGAVNVGMGGPREVMVAVEDLAAARELLDAPTHGSPAAADERDVVLEQRRSTLSRGFGLIVVLLFGVPFALAGIWWVVDLLSLTA